MSEQNKKNGLNRRQFLQGLGGATLYLPLLPSLLSKEALAAATAGPVQRRFVGIQSSHGSLHFDNWYPKNTPSQTMDLYSGHTIRWGSLPSFVSGGQLSPVLTANFNNYLSKMNLIRGMDILMYLGHHRSVLGNFYNNDNGSKEMLTAMPSIDQIMAYSRRFYTSTPTGPRSIVLSSSNSISWGYRNPQIKDPSTVNDLSPFKDPVSAYNAVFAVGDASASNPDTVLGKKITNDVFEDYKKLSRSSRIGKEDKTMLEGHMSMLSELENRLEGFSAACATKKPGGQGSFDDGSRYMLMNDVISAAFKCGMSRIATMHMDYGLGTSGGGNWHAWAHSADTSSSQTHLVDLNKFTAEKVFLDLVKKLDVVEDPLSGKTYLDNSLIVWGQEHAITHSCVSMPIITAGSAGGRINTGRYVDYRNLQKTFHKDTNDEFEGVLYNRFLVTCLQAMGLSQPDYQIKGMPGYGDTANNSYTGFRNNRVGRYKNELANLNKPLELIYKG